ncbi:GRB2-associated-binding protein 2-like isoform X2 [Littorina saxatilis]|uniref:GRB2-associated-binding protein 2-like isoform X2 n=1 Tax=Littorina saxatilis TaxID=31220 RepID=UPI0038B4B614
MCFLKVGDKTNKRLGAMNKLNIVHSGWMTKSPPEHKLQSPLKIFRALFVSLFPQKWKLRFFVLHKPSGSLPDQYELSYYNSEQCSKKKGSIDLDQCEQIIESLDSDQYPYLLAIKTICRGKVRTYYLATNSEENMSTWVQCLCRVCGLKQEDTHIPDSRLSTHSTSGNSTAAQPVAGSNSVWSTPAPSPTVTSQPMQAPPSRTPTVTSSTSSTSSHPDPSTSPQSYVLLNECTSGPVPVKRSERYDRAESIDSVPDFPAPPPPMKKGPSHLHYNNMEDDGKDHDSVFEPYDRPPATGGQETYDRPRPGSGHHELYDRPRSGEFKHSEESSDEDFYKVLPNAGGQVSLLRVTRNSASSDTVDLNLKTAVPLPMPRRSPHSARSSLSDRPDSMGSMGRPMTENYDVPPPRPVSTSSQEAGDNPPAPPQRPPKPHRGLASQSPYQNLPSNSKVYENNSLNAVPTAPPKNCSSATVLSYDVPRGSTVISPPRDHSELEVAPPAPAPRVCGPAGGHSYLNTVPGFSNSPVVPPFPDTYLPVRNGDKGDQDMDSSPPAPGQCRTDPSYADMNRGGGNQDLYQVPPVAPRPPRSNTLPSRIQGATGAETEQTCIWSNTRTKSFKRNNHISHSPTPPRPPPLGPRRPPLPPAPDVATSSDDDDNRSYDGSSTHHEMSVLRMSTVPTAPDHETEPELKYLDLCLDTPPEPTRTQATNVHHGTPTEYREIDFVKTRALQDVKKARNLNNK